MAQKVQVLLVDDIDGGEANATVTFGLDGYSYEIDLSAAHADEFRAVLAPWVSAARKVTGSSGTARRARRGATTGPSADTIREWARANSHHVSDRGRISQTVRAAYEAAH